VVAENLRRDPEADWGVSLAGNAWSPPFFEIRKLTE
jgi:hypothetical protein